MIFDVERAFLNGFLAYEIFMDCLEWMEDEPQEKIETKNTWAQNRTGMLLYCETLKAWYFKCIERTIQSIQCS